MPASSSSVGFLLDNGPDGIASSLSGVSTCRGAFAAEGPPIYGHAPWTCAPIVLVSQIHLGVVLLGAHFYSRNNFKPNRAAALAE